MTLRDFVKTYEEFEWESGEVVVVDQRYAVNFIFTCKDGELKNPLCEFVLRNLNECLTVKSIRGCNQRRRWSLHYKIIRLPQSGT